MQTECRAASRDIVSKGSDRGIFWQKRVFAARFPSWCSHSPPQSSKPFHTLPRQRLQTQSVFLIHTKDSYLSKSIHPSSLYFTPISFQICPKDVWVSPTWPFLKLFSYSLLVNILLAFVFRHLFPEHKIMGCCARSGMLSCMLSIVHYPTCLSLSH